MSTKSSSIGECAKAAVISKKTMYLLPVFPQPVNAHSARGTTCNGVPANASPRFPCAIFYVLNLTFTVSPVMSYGHLHFTLGTDLISLIHATTRACLAGT